MGSFDAEMTLDIDHNMFFQTGLCAQQRPPSLISREMLIPLPALMLLLLLFAAPSSSAATKTKECIPKDFQASGFPPKFGQCSQRNK